MAEPAPTTGGLFPLPDSGGGERCDPLLERPGLRIERIVSRGHTSPESGWYDQPQHEWVLVLRGAAVLAFESGEVIELGPGSHVNIPAHSRHRVQWTDPECATVWLAVHYEAST